MSKMSSWKVVLQLEAPAGLWAAPFPISSAIHNPWEMPMEIPQFGSFNGFKLRCKKKKHDSKNSRRFPKQRQLVLKVFQATGGAIPTESLRPGGPVPCIPRHCPSRNRQCCCYRYLRPHIPAGSYWNNGRKRRQQGGSHQKNTVMG